MVVKQIPVIVEQLQTIKADVTERANKAMSLICNDETVVSVKNERAKLRKEFEEYENQRKAIKNTVMSPYEQFEVVYKDCVTDVFKKADADLKGKIDSVENELKAKKAKEVRSYFNEYLESKNIDFVTYETANINVTMSASLKSLKNQAKDFIDRICDDLTLIETQEHKDEIMFEYKKSLNVSGAITTVKNRYKAIEEEKAREEERKARAEAEQKSAEKVAEILTPPTVEEPKEEKVLTLKFTVRGTMSQLKELKEFLNNRGYDYE